MWPLWRLSCNHLLTCKVCVCVQVFVQTGVAFVAVIMPSPVRCVSVCRWSCWSVWPLWQLSCHHALTCKVYVCVCVCAGVRADRRDVCHASTPSSVRCVSVCRCSCRQVWWLSCQHTFICKVCLCAGVRADRCGVRGGC